MKITKRQLKEHIRKVVREQMERDNEPYGYGEYPLHGNRSDDSVQKSEYDGSSGFHSKEAEEAWFAERELEEQVGGWRDLEDEFGDGAEDEFGDVDFYDEIPLEDEDYYTQEMGDYGDGPYHDPEEY